MVARNWGALGPGFETWNTDRFIEVKTRTARDLAPAEIAVDFNKRKVLRRLARRSVHQLPKNDPPDEIRRDRRVSCSGSGKIIPALLGSFSVDDNWRS